MDKNLPPKGGESGSAAGLGGALQPGEHPLGVGVLAGR